MTEQLLQFIWQKQYFNRGELQTTRGEPLEILSPGLWNRNQGPDFFDARVKIGETVWAGTVELHLLSSGWDLHGHGKDPNFNNVILHVVWENDSPEQHMPVLELRDRVPRSLLRRYEEMFHQTVFIPCENLIGGLDKNLVKGWMDRLLLERLDRKAAGIARLLESSRQNWPEVYWWLLARNFGHSVNAESFEAVARRLSMPLLNRHRHQIHQLEALLLGTAGLLEGKFKDDYPLMLQKEFHFLKRKYGLASAAVPVHFLRMRPANFPTIRLAQLAALVHTGGHQPDLVLGSAVPEPVQEVFCISANDYWLTHYLPDRLAEYREKRLGKAMFDNILINTIVPFIYTYGIDHNDENLRKKALHWLLHTAAEANTITSGFRELGYRPASAGESQALLELKTRYCDQKNCLGCEIGSRLLGIPH